MWYVKTTAENGDSPSPALPHRLFWGFVPCFIRLLKKMNRSQRAELYPLLWDILHKDLDLRNVQNNSQPNVRVGSESLSYRSTPGLYVHKIMMIKDSAFITPDLNTKVPQINKSKALCNLHAGLVSF